MIEKKSLTENQLHSLNREMMVYKKFKNNNGLDFSGVKESFSAEEALNYNAQASAGFLEDSKFFQPISRNGLINKLMLKFVKITHKIFFNFNRKQNAFNHSLTIMNEEIIAQRSRINQLERDLKSFKDQG